MGKKSKDKKKGKGIEKTAAKTEKKLSNKMQKELQKLGEENIEDIVAQIEREESKRLQVTETIVEPPSRRLNFTFIPHPDKEQLILYGGEFYNGQKTFVYNDLYFYNIPNNTWTLIKAPAGPPPRCGHQMIATSANKGQLWVFAGEYASETQSQFYHYRDLWVFHLAKKQWEKVQAPGGPSARSGHRMVYTKKNLIVFGGFHDNLRNYKYFNDVYVFNIENYAWTKLEPSGTPPAPRSACCMVALNDGRVLIYGGYSKETVKKDLEKGRVFTDAFLLTADKNDTTGTKWKWFPTKLGGAYLSPRCSMPMTVAPNNLATYCYGGVFDKEDDEENLAGTFFNDFYSIDLDKLIWKRLIVSGKQEKELKSKRELEEETTNQNQDMDVEQIEENVKMTTISDDGVFKVSVGPALPSTSENKLIKSNEKCNEVFTPSSRINCGLAIKHGILYLYGGMFEDGDKQLTFSDFYSIDLKKLDEWKVLISDDTANVEWIDSDSESSRKSGDEESEEDESEESEGEEEMETN